MSAARPTKPDPHSNGPTAGGPTQASVPAGAKNGGSPTAIGQAAPSGSRSLSRQRKHQLGVLSQTGNEPGSGETPSATKSARPAQWNNPSAGERGNMAAAAALYREGLTYTQIAAMLGLKSKNSVAGLIHRARRGGIDVPHRQPSRPKRPPAQPAAGRSYGDAGRGATRGGKPSMLRVKQLRKDGPTAFNLFHRIEAKAEARPSSYIAKGSVFEPLPGVQPVAFGSPGCKFPVDGFHGRGLLACGLTRRDGISYCDSHARLAYQPRLAGAA